MTIFLRLLRDEDKSAAIDNACKRLRAGLDDPRRFDVRPDSFDDIPGKPFAYWVSQATRKMFQRLPGLEVSGCPIKVGLQTSDDFRFYRLWWEVRNVNASWRPLAKGGAASPYYADVYVLVHWGEAGAQIANFADRKSGKVLSRVQNVDYYFRPSLFQTLRAAALKPHVTPAGCIFDSNGTAAFPKPSMLMATLALLNSQVADGLHKLMLGRAGYALYRGGSLARLPVPPVEAAARLEELGRMAWEILRSRDVTDERSHAFTLPTRGMLLRAGSQCTDDSLVEVQNEIDSISGSLYGLDPDDQKALTDVEFGDDAVQLDDDLLSVEDSEEPSGVDDAAATASWAVGVAFGRFDWRLATGERPLPSLPGPIDPLPAFSPGMLPAGSTAFHVSSGILVDDSGHPADLVRLVEELLSRVDAPVPGDMRRWLQKDFFPFHLQRYSKSRRKAPIYWPLATASGSYTLWLYYPSLSTQTLYTAINDLLDGPNGKLKQVAGDLAALRTKGSARTRDEERRFETLEAFELELIELRDTLLKIAPTFRPNHDDGVQITAAPLWPLFRHKPWQKILKDTWSKLEKGDYDWAHLAMNYWPDRVREKCTTDKSLGIAHGLEHLYVEPEAKPKKTRGRKTAGDVE